MSTAAVVKTAPINTETKKQDKCSQVAFQGQKSEKIDGNEPSGVFCAIVHESTFISSQSFAQSRYGTVSTKTFAILRPTIWHTRNSNINSYRAYDAAHLAMNCNEPARLRRNKSLAKRMRTMWEERLDLTSGTGLIASGISF